MVLLLPDFVTLFQPAREFRFAPMRILIYHETLSVAGWEARSKMDRGSDHGYNRG